MVSASHCSRLQIFWDNFVFKWHPTAKCGQPQINTLMPRELKRWLKDVKIRKTGVWSLSSFHISSHRKISAAALEGRVFIHQYCAREDSMGMVSTAKVTQVIQKGQCGKTESQLFGSSKSHKQAHPGLCRFISTTYTGHYVPGLYPSSPFTVHNNNSPCSLIAHHSVPHSWETLDQNYRD